MWGIDYMKTKIIYISGNEIFEMAEIRAAFDEVRSALGLDKDTILFGVPVDNDNALSNVDYIKETKTITSVQTIDSEPVEFIEETEQVAEITTTEHEPEIINEASESNNPEFIEEETEAAAPQQEQSEKVIPILSVLASKTIEPDPVNEDMTDDIEPKKTETEETFFSEPEIVTDINITSEISAPVINDNQVEIEKTTIVNMIEEPAPVAQQEKTIEELLESMKPLREDIAAEDNMISDDAPISDEDNFLDAETDATLEQLASEFAQNEDKIIIPEKSQPQGKIGKLKNILPFKKAKRDDNSLMGDLFGWAGIAANDDDFAIPGFFANAGQKKQGA